MSYRRICFKDMFYGVTCLRVGKYAPREGMNFGMICSVGKVGVLKVCHRLMRACWNILLYIIGRCVFMEDILYWWTCIIGGHIN